MMHLFFGKKIIMQFNDFWSKAVKVANFTLPPL